MCVTEGHKQNIFGTFFGSNFNSFLKHNFCGVKKCDDAEDQQDNLGSLSDTCLLSLHVSEPRSQEQDLQELFYSICNWHFKQH